MMGGGARMATIQENPEEKEKEEETEDEEP
jgi:hypothetical protein